MTKARFASLTAGLLARKGEAAPPAALFNKAPSGPPKSPAQFDDVSPEMQDRIESIVRNPNAPSNWTQPPADPDEGSEPLDLDSDYDMGDQRSDEKTSAALGGNERGAQGTTTLVSESRQHAVAERQSENALFSRVTPVITPRFGRRVEPKGRDEPKESLPTNKVLISMRPKKMRVEEVKSKAANRTLIVSKAAAPETRRTAITLRLDEVRYLRLKYAGAHLGKTSQAILETALDAYLTSLGDEFTHDTEWLRKTVSIIKKPKQPS